MGRDLHYAPTSSRLKRASSDRVIKCRLREVNTIDEKLKKCERRPAAGVDRSDGWRIAASSLPRISARLTLSAPASKAPIITKLLLRSRQKKRAQSHDSVLVKASRENRTRLPIKTIYTRTHQTQYTSWVALLFRRSGKLINFTVSILSPYLCGES